MQICRALLRDERPTFTGAHYSTLDARNVPAPVQAGGVPIMIGGSGERRTLKLVAQYADMCNVSGGVETVRHKLDVLAHALLASWPRSVGDHDHSPRDAWC